jgi:hypothetical protein
MLRNTILPLGLLLSLQKVQAAQFTNLVMPTPTPGESGACWSDRDDPVCDPDQWLDRDGLRGVLETLPYSDATAGHCVCRDLRPDCPEKTYWDAGTGQCVCLQKCACSEHQYFNQDSCECECVQYAECPDVGGHDMYWSSNDCKCKCVPHPETCLITSQSNSFWNA